jgi:hypothetical protein
MENNKGKTKRSEKKGGGRIEVKRKKGGMKRSKK